MSGFRTSTAPRAPAWSLPARDLLQAERAAGFLERDLSEQALRQPAEPVFNRAELADAKREGVEQGRAAGLAEAAASLAAAEAEALGRIAAAMADGRAEAARVADHAAGALARAMVAAMNATMPHLVQRSALSEASAMLAHVLPGLSREPHVRVEVPRALVGGTEAAVAKLAPEHRGRICVAELERGAQDGMAAGEVQVSWSSGHARRRPAQVWLAVMKTLEPTLGEPGSEADDNGD